MIILEHINRIVESTLKERFQLAKEQKMVPIEMTTADFDGVTFHIYSPDDNNVLNVSINAPCMDSLVKYGALTRLKDVYGEYLVTTEPGWSATLSANLASLPDDHASLALRFALLKRHLFASPFYYAIDAVKKGKDEILDIPFRYGERTFIIPTKERCTIIYSVNFSDSDDMVFGKIFLTEFKKSIGAAPSFDFSPTAPGELASIKNIGQDDGYVTCVLFERHYKPGSLDGTVDMAMMFRNYLMYHIKCSKSHLNTRMRNRVDSLLKVLNRSKQEIPKEKKTATGRTFARTPAK